MDVTIVDVDAEVTAPGYGSFSYYAAATTAMTDVSSETTTADVAVAEIVLGYGSFSY